MKTQTITWHPYPDEKPNEYGNYIVTVAYDLFDRNKGIDIWTFCKNDEFQKVGYWGIPEAHVIAWAEMPKAYERKEI